MQLRMMVHAETVEELRKEAEEAARTLREGKLEVSDSGASTDSIAPEDPVGGPDEEGRFVIEEKYFHLVMETAKIAALDYREREVLLDKIARQTSASLPGDTHRILARELDGLRFRTEQQKFLAKNREKFLWRPEAHFGYTGDVFEAWCLWPPKGGSQGPRWYKLESVINSGTSSTALSGQQVEGPFEDPEPGTKFKSPVFSELLPVKEFRFSAP